MDKEPVTQDSIEGYKLHRQQIKDIEKKKEFRAAILAIILLWFICLAGFVYLNLPDFAKDYIRSILDQGRTPTILECEILNDCAAQWTARLATAKALEKLSGGLN